MISEIILNLYLESPIIWITYQYESWKIY